MIVDKTFDIILQRQRRKCIRSCCCWHKSRRRWQRNFSPDDKIGEKGKCSKDEKKKKVKKENNRNNRLRCVNGETSYFSVSDQENYRRSKHRRDKRADDNYEHYTTLRLVLPIKSRTEKKWAGHQDPRKSTEEFDPQYVRIMIMREALTSLRLECLKVVFIDDAKH